MSNFESTVQARRARPPGRTLIAASCVTMALATLSQAALAGSFQSVGPMAFAGPDTLVVSDWRAGELHALQLPSRPPGASKAFNLKNISSPIARALHTQVDKLRFEDMAFRPGTQQAYIALSIERDGAKPVPALVAIDAAGKVTVIDLAKTPNRSAEIKDKPAPDKTFWGDVPAATYTVTDVLFDNGKLYVAGLSNESFASTLRVYDFPFTGSSTMTSVEMYHAVHNQIETRAPIRKMIIATLNGEPSLIAAYTCTPLVTIPLKDLKDGAHIVGKTVAELGWGSQPMGMIQFDAGQGPVVLLANSHKGADMMTVAAIAEASAKPGLSAPIKWPSEPYLGVKATPIPIASIDRMAVQDKDFLVQMRRDQATGSMQLISLRKGIFLRLSDFINEYDFADFRYLPTDGFKGVHQMLRNDEGFPDLAARSAP